MWLIQELYIPVTRHHSVHHILQTLRIQCTARQKGNCTCSQISLTLKDFFLQFINESL